MTAAPKEQPKTSEAMANELTWYDAPLPYGVRMGARRPKYQGYGLPKGFPQSRLSDIDECQETAQPCGSRAFRRRSPHPPICRPSSSCIATYAWQVAGGPAG